MSDPCKQFERMTVAGQLRHGGNAVLRWMASNATARTDPSGNIKPDKQRSADKIDGIVTMVMAIGRAMFTTDDRASVYATRDIITL